MNKLTGTIRKYIGLIVSIVGLFLLVILTFGDIGELFTEKYWENVGGNLTSIGAVTIGLVLIQTTIKQGISEQALSAGLNTENTREKYKEHKNYIKSNQDKQIYLPYFLTLRNQRETKRRKREFLVDNGFKSELSLYQCKKKKLIKAYNSILTNTTVDDIKWSTTEIKYNKNGSIEKLEIYRSKRLRKGLVMGFISMIATAFITGGMFLDNAEIPIWQKLIKLATYLITIAMTVIFDIGKNYEKGAFGVPNELDEINSIWLEFQKWTVPNWVIEEVRESEKLFSIGEDNLKNKSKKTKPILLGYDSKNVVKEKSYEEDKTINT